MFFFSTFVLWWEEKCKFDYDSMGLGRWGDEVMMSWLCRSRTGGFPADVFFWSISFDLALKSLHNLQLLRCLFSICLSLFRARRKTAEFFILYFLSLVLSFSCQSCSGNT